MASEPKTPAPPRPAAVYLIQRRDRRCFKLGTSVDPLQRARSLPEFQARALDLDYSLALWLPSKSRAQQVERGMHKCLAPYSYTPGHLLSGYSEWFSPVAFLPAMRLLQQVPKDTGGVRSLGLRPLLEGGAELVDREMLTPQDVWWALEDLLLRVATLLPVSAVFNGEHWSVTLGGFRNAWNGGMRELRPRIMDTDTFGWNVGRSTGNFLSLAFYEGDALVLQLVPRAKMRQWVDGDAVVLQIHALMHRFGGPVDRFSEVARA